jgi:hypothetical protein
MVKAGSLLACRHENPHFSSNGSPLIVHSEERNHEEDDVMGKLGECTTNHRQSRRFYGVQSFMEYLKKSPRLSHVPEEIPVESGDVSGAIKHYRKLYQPVENRRKKFDVLFLKGFSS